MTAEPLDFDALAALEQAATPGPWDATQGTGGIDLTSNGWDRITVGATVADAALIAAARNALPALIAAARERDSLTDEIEDYWHGELVNLVAQRDAARAEVAALRERVEGMAVGCERRAAQELTADPTSVRAQNYAIVAEGLRRVLTTGVDQ